MTQKRKFYMTVVSILLFMVVSVFGIITYVRAEMNRTTVDSVLVAKQRIEAGSTFSPESIVEDYFEEKEVHIEKLSKNDRYFTSLEEFEEMLSKGEHEAISMILEEGIIYVSYFVESGAIDNVGEREYVEVPVKSVATANAPAGTLVEGGRVTVVGIIDDGRGSKSIHTIYSGAVITKIRGSVNDPTVGLTLTVDAENRDTVLGILNTENSANIFYLRGNLGDSSISLEELQRQVGSKTETNLNGVFYLEYKDSLQSSEYKEVEENSLIELNFSAENANRRGFNIRWGGRTPVDVLINHIDQEGRRGNFTGYYNIGDTNDRFNIKFDHRNKEFYLEGENNLSKFNQNGLYEVVFSFIETVETIDEDENITFEDVLVKYSYYFLVKENTRNINVSELNFINEFAIFAEENDLIGINDLEKFFENKIILEDNSNSLLKVTNSSEAFKNTHNYQINRILMNDLVVKFNFKGLEHNTVNKAFEAQKNRILELLVDLSIVNIPQNSREDMLRDIIYELSSETEVFYQNLEKLSYYEAKEIIDYLENVYDEVKNNSSFEFTYYAHMVYIFMGGKIELLNDPGNDFYKDLLETLAINNLTFELINVSGDKVESAINIDKDIYGNEFYIQVYTDLYNFDLEGGN